MDRRQLGMMDRITRKWIKVNLFGIRTRICGQKCRNQNFGSRGSISVGISGFHTLLDQSLYIQGIFIQPARCINALKSIFRYSFICVEILRRIAVLLESFSKAVPRLMMEMEKLPVCIRFPKSKPDTVIVKIFTGMLGVGPKAR